MALSSTNAIGFAYIKEATIGTTPATPTLIALPYVESSIDVEYKKISDDSKRPDNQSGAPTVTSYEVKGDITFNMRNKQYDDLLLAGLQGSAWTTNVAKLANTQTGFTFEERDAQQGFYRVFRGCEITTFKLSMKPDAAVKATLGITGRTVAIGSATIATATTAIDDTKINMNAVQNASVSFDGGATLSATEFELTIDHSINQLNAIGQAGSVGSAGGKKKISGSFTGFGDGILSTWANKNSGNTKTAVSIQFGDGTNSFTLNIPQIYTTKFETTVDIEGVRGIKVDFDGVFDTTLGSTVFLTRSS